VKKKLRVTGNKTQKTQAFSYNSHKSVSEWDWDVLVEDVLLRAGITESTCEHSEEPSTSELSLSKETGDGTGSSSSLWRLGDLEFSSEKEDSGDGEMGLL
jgi:hypothetical protein